MVVGTTYSDPKAPRSAALLGSAGSAGVDVESWDDAADAGAGADSDADADADAVASGDEASDAAGDVATSARVRFTES